MSISIRKKKLKNGEQSLYLDYYINGKRNYEFLDLRLTKNSSTNREVYQIAENIKAQRLLEINSDQYGFINSHKKKQSFINFFQEEVKSRPPDRTSWDCTFKKIKNYSNGHLSFSEINEDWLLGFQKYLLSEVSQITAHHYFANLKTALNKAVKQKYISSNPCNRISNIKKPDTKREFLTIDEIQKLSNTKCSNAETKRAFLFACFTGLRYSDICNLTWSNIKEGVIEYRQKKTKSLEYLPLSVTAKRILYNTDDKIQFLPQPQTKIFNMPTKLTSWEALKNWVIKAEINKRVSFHTSRHTFATLSLSYGVDLYTTSKLLGHKNISTTQVYAKIIDERKKEAIEKLPSILIG